MSVLMMVPVITSPGLLILPVNHLTRSQWPELIDTPDHNQAVIDHSYQTQHGLLRCNTHYEQRSLLHWFMASCNILNICCYWLQITT